MSILRRDEVKGGEMRDRDGEREGREGWTKRRKIGRGEGAKKQPREKEGEKNKDGWKGRGGVIASFAENVLISDNEGEKEENGERKKSMEGIQ